MRKLFNWVAARLVAAFALALPLAAWAAPNATAVWRSNLGQSYTIGGDVYALKIYGAGTDSAAGILNLDGTVTVTNEWTGWSSPCFEFGSDVTSISVLVKFSGFAAVTDDYGACLAAMRDSSGNEVGAYVAKGATHLSAFYKASGDSGPTQVKLNGSDDAVVGNGYMLFSYSTSGGVKVYMGSSIDGLVGGAASNYRYSNKTISRLAIGGDADGAYYTPTGFTIEEVALFVGSSYTASDVADYVFPTVTVDTTSSMTMTELNTKVAAFGENTFNYFSASPVVTYDVAPSDATTTYLRSALWNGTVFIKDQNIENLNPTIYGNPNSTLKLSGVSGHWGAAVYEKTATPAIELEDSETEGREYGYFASNGYSFYSQGSYYYVHTPELKGSGTYKANTTGNAALFVADKFDNFTGKLNLEGKTVWLGTGAPTKSVDTWNNQVNFPGTVRLGSAIPANYSTWNVPNGYKGTVVLTAAASEQYQVNFLTSSTWKGTCQLNWNATGKLDIVNYGNANSVIEIPSTFSALPTQNGGSDGAEVAAEVKIIGSWTVSDGWTGEAYRTTFAKLSGTGTLTVNGGSGGVGDPIPYTITRLEGFTGTIAGTRGKFTIGTIVAATEPTPGTKLVNFTTANAPVLDSTKVVYNNAEQDVELEFKAGDGIYVKAVAYVVFQQESGQSFIDVTNYYSTVSNAIDAAKAMKKTVVLIAQPEATDTYNISAGETINVKKGEFTFDGIIFPEGAQYNNTTTEIAGVTQYKCAVNTATIQYPGQEPVGMTGQLIQILGGLYSGYVPGYAGTVVTVLDGSDATLGDVMPEVFTYNSEAHTYTLKTMVASYNNGYTTTYYPTVSNAVATVASGSTITLVENVALDESVEVAAGKNVTIDLNGKTITGPAGGYVFANAGEVTITGNGTVAGAGGIAENTASDASVSIASGNYTATGDLFANVEGATIAVSGGTFNKSVADEYLAEGYEVTNNGDGTYGVREDKGWIYAEEGYWNYTGTWSGVDVDPSAEAVTIETNATYMANRPSAGQLVTVAMTLSFDDVNDDASDLGDAKAAVRLAAGETDGTYQFQLYTSDDENKVWTNATVDVTATKEVDYNFVFVLDLTNKTYTASIVSGATTNALSIGESVTEIPFACLGNVAPVQRIEFIGAGTVTSIAGSYEDAMGPAVFVEDEPIALSDDSVQLSADQAAWLNKLGAKSVVSEALATLSSDQFSSAYLLNLDLTDTFTYEFTVSDITVGDSTVEVEVTLTRTGTLVDGKSSINGTLKLMGGATLPASGFVDLHVAPVGDDDFSDGDTATWSFGKGDAKFFQPVIE